MIFDTNVLIYLSKELLQPEIFLKITGKIEALGFNFVNPEEHNLLLDLCGAIPVLSVTDEIAEATIHIRQNHKMKLPDAIIYATALVEGLPLLTNNISDFKSLGNQVELIDPFTL